ncbi:MAG TPA: RluA family pseudouridine synthase [Methylomirabilota bacterium]|nr:RluA family pseudouridine synthase [Methylomirabilota bacterium]
MDSGARPTILERLRSAFPDSSGRRLRAWLAAGRVRLGGRVVRDPRTPAPTDEPVALGAPPPPALAPPLRLVHEDEALLVIEKPAGLLTIATIHERERTAYHLVWRYLAAGRPARRPFIVHRLDRETSGLLVVAKALAAKRRLQADFAAGRVERGYVAVVEGAVAAAEGTLRDVLVEDRSLRVRPARAPRAAGSSRARTAVTHYRVLERRGDVTVLALTLGTGRRHQIRVQLAALGHPILGDRPHGARRDPLGRIALHAARLAFRHPVSGRPAVFTSPPPSAFERIGRARAGPR